MFDKIQTHNWMIVKFELEQLKLHKKNNRRIYMEDIKQIPEMEDIV